jgi:biotin-dependent carboxylase-like uncharacterized protein
MTPALRVLAPGLLSTIQDSGRPGYQGLGIPVGGALDPVSFRAANALVGNAADTGAIEVAYVGPTLAVDADEVRLAFAGAQAPIDIFADEFAMSGERIEGMRSVCLRRGQVVRVGSLHEGAVLYVAVEGGFDIEPVLGSVSTCLRAGFGGWQGRALIAGDRLPLRRNVASERNEYELTGLDLAPPERFRVILGPQRDHFSDRAIEVFLSGEYTISAGADRMGMRLEGPVLEHVKHYSITSDGIAPGSIQVTGTGQPIVLLADRQTIGGYAKIATVISADLPALARLPIGAKVAFEEVSIEAAVAARRDLHAQLNSLDDQVMPIVRAGIDIAPRLLESNLISGIVDARIGLL